MPKETFLRLRIDKQERIMRTAISEFIKNGFERTKVGDIAAGAGVAKGSIYQYFDDKKDLFVYCAEWGLEVFMKKLDERMHIGDMDIFEYFEDNVPKTEVLEEEHELAVFMQLIEREPGLIDASMQSMYSIADAYIKKLIQNSKKKGTVRTDIDDDLLMVYFLGVTERFEQRWMARYIDFTKDMIEENSALMQKELGQMLKLLKNGMGC